MYLFQLNKTYICFLYRGKYSRYHLYFISEQTLLGEKQDCR